MQKIDGYDEAQALTGEYERLEAGGYICKIINAKEEISKTNKRMLVLAIDIVDGEQKDYFKRRFEELKKANNDPNKQVKYPVGGVYRQMLEGEKSAGYLKGLMTSLSESNPNFKWDWDEKKLIGLQFGGIFGEEEYEKMDGTVGKSVKIKYIRTVKSIKEGKFEVPELKKLPPKGEAFEGFTTNTEYDDDLPF